MPPPLPSSTKGWGSTGHPRRAPAAAAITPGAGSPHTHNVLYCHSQCYNTQTYLLLLHLHFLFSPFRTDTTVIPGSGTAAGFMWFEASPDKALPKQSGARALSEQSLSPSPGVRSLGSGPAGPQCSCVNPEQAAGEQPWQTALQEASLDTLPHLRAAFQLRSLALGRALQVPLHPAFCLTNPNSTLRT